MSTELFSLQDFEKALSEMKFVPKEYVVSEDKGEYVVTIPLNGLSMVIRTSISPKTNESNSTGQDSIRLGLFAYNRPAGSKSDAYTTRVIGWQGRLEEKINMLMSLSKQAGTCKVCGGAMGIFIIQKEGPNKGKWFAKCMANDAHFSKSFTYVNPTLPLKQDAIQLTDEQKKIVTERASVFLKRVDKLNLEKLNEFQVEIVKSLGKGAKTIRAIPGSGKTRVLELLVANMLINGVNPSRIGVFTFSNKASDESRVRIAKALWPDISDAELAFFATPKKKVDDFNLDDVSYDRSWVEADPIRKFLVDWVCTIHALSLRLLKGYGLKLKAPDYKQEREIDNLIKDSLAELKWEEGPKTVKIWIGNAIHRLVKPYEAYDFFSNLLASNNCPTHHAKNLAELYKRYLAYMQKNNLVDFNMMQATVVTLLRNDPGFRAYACNMFDYVLVDEAQDTDDLQTEILWTIAGKNGNCFYIGDEDQCVLDKTEIVCNNKVMLAQDISIGDNITCGSGNSKITTGKVVNIYKHWVETNVVKVTTSSGKSLTTTPDHTYFAGYLISEIKPYFFTYIMYKEGLGFRIGVTRSLRSKTTDENRIGFEHRLNQERGDAVWILKVCNTEVESRYYEQLYSIKYSIPTWLFYSRDSTYSQYSDEDIKRLHKNVDSASGAMRLFADEAIDINHPHHIPRATSTRRRRNIVLTMLTSDGTHVAVSGSDDSDARLLSDSGFNVRPSKKSKGWRVETVTTIPNAYKLIEGITKVLDCNILEKARLTSKSLPFTKASNLRIGMSVFVQDGDKVVLDTIESVEKESFVGYVYDFDVERYHNFCAQGIFTHNSMYRFRGAVPEVIRDKFEQHWKVSVSDSFVLPINYRSTKKIVGLSSSFINFNYAKEELSRFKKPFSARSDAPDGVDPTFSYSKEFESLADQLTNDIYEEGNPGNWFVLSRTRAECAALHMEFIKKKIPAINKAGGIFFGSEHIRKVLAYARLACNYQNARDDLDTLKEVCNVASSEFRAPITRHNHIEGCINYGKSWGKCNCPIVMVEGQDYSHVRYYGARSIDEAGCWEGVIKQQTERNNGGFLSLASKGATDLVSFVERIEKLSDNASAALRMIIDESVKPWLAKEEGLDNSDLSENGKVEDFGLIQSMATDKMTLVEFLEEIDKLTMGGKEGDEKNSVLIGTVHWSKGAERPCVAVNMTRMPIVPPSPKEGHLPTGSPPLIEDERNILYVAMTRAKEVLKIYFSEKFNGMEMPISQFISELGFTFEESFDEDVDEGYE